MLGLRHYQFRNYLASKVTMQGRELCIVTEEFTSKTCGRCGHIHQNLGAAKTFRCVSNLLLTNKHQLFLTQEKREKN